MGSFGAGKSSAGSSSRTAAYETGMGVGWAWMWMGRLLGVDVESVGGRERAMRKEGLRGVSRKGCGWGVSSGEWGGGRSGRTPKPVTRTWIGGRSGSGAWEPIRVVEVGAAVGLSGWGRSWHCNDETSPLDAVRRACI